MKTYPENATKIDATRMGELDRRIAKLNKRAAKLGCEPVGYEVIDSFVETRQISNTRTQYFVDVNVVIPIGDAPVMAGWKLIARLEHPGDDMNLVYSVPGEECPAEYRTTGRKCDHCSKNRARKDTFVVQNVETGEYKQVGSNCVADFLGHMGPDHALKMAAFYTSISLGGESDEETYRDNFMKGYCYIDTERFLTYVAALVENFGWAPRSGNLPTANDALDMIFFHGGTDEYSKRIMELLALVNDDHKTMATECVNWMLNDMQTKNDYQWNLKAAAVAGTTTVKNAGILASGIVAFAKAKEWALKRQMDAKRDSAKSNEWVAEKGERARFDNLTLVAKRWIETQFGESDLYRFEDEKGNVIVWFSSGSARIEVGDVVNLTGRVKKLDDYKGRKQTVLSRCTIHDQVAAKEAVNA